MPKLLVIADDLTGANDVGAQFAKQGVPVLVRPFIANQIISWTDGLEVQAVSTESRHISATEAAERVSGLVTRGLAAGVTHFFKKTDSTMRGNLGSEMEALLTASGRTILPFVPAVPQLGRITRGGCQFVGGTPISESTFADDPIDRIESGYIPDIISIQSRVPASVIGFNELPELEGRELTAGIYVFDAATDDELQQIGEVLKRCGLLEVVAGAAGLASVMPKLLDFARRDRRVPRVNGRALIVNGSLNAASVAQVAEAEREGFAVFTLPPQLLVPTPGAGRSEFDKAVAEILHLAEGRDVVIRSIENHTDLRGYLDLGERSGLKPADVYLNVADNIAAVVSRLMQRSEFKVVAVFGGDTLAAIVRSLGWSGLWPCGEITPGLVALEVDPGRDVLLLTKAGGYGGIDLLGKVRDYIRSNER